MVPVTAYPIEPWKISFMKDVPSFHVTVTVVWAWGYIPRGIQYPGSSTFSERKGYCISYVPVGG